MEVVPPLAATPPLIVVVAPEDAAPNELDPDGKGNDCRHVQDVGILFCLFPCNGESVGQ
jgi:hypothetical protein